MARSGPGRVRGLRVVGMWAVGLWGAAVVLGAAACAGRSGPTSTGAAPPAPSLTGTVTDDRYLRPQGRVAVRLQSTDGDAVQVTSYQLRHPLFETLDAEQRDSVVPADGSPLIRPLLLGPVRCDAADPAGAVVVLGVQSADGTRSTVEVPLADGTPSLTTLHDRQCAIVAVTDVVDLRIVPEARPLPSGAPDPSDGPAVTAVLQLTRRGDGPVVVEAITPSILFSPLAELPITLPDTVDARVEVPLRVTVARCDTHALIESKTSFTFPVSTAVADEEAVAVPVTVDPQVRSALQALLGPACGLTDLAPQETG